MLLHFAKLMFIGEGRFQNANLHINCLETYPMSAIRQYVYTPRVALSATLSVRIVWPLYYMCGVFSLGLVMHAGTLVLLR